MTTPNYVQLVPGIYKNSVSGLVTTWDIRMKRPNAGDYLTPEVIHTIELTMRDYLRDRFGDYRFLGVFPMGDQTGFYVLTRFVDSTKIYETIIEYIFDLRKYDLIEVTEKICGNCELLNIDLKDTQKELNAYLSRYLSRYHSATNYTD